MERDVNVTKLLKFYHYSRPAGFEFEGHTHIDREFKFVVRGELETTYEDVVITLKAGDCLLCEPGAFHRERALEGSTEYVVLHFHSDSISYTGKPKVATLTGNDLILMNLIATELETENCALDMSRKPDMSKYNSTAKKLFEVLLYKILRNSYIPVYAAGKKNIIYNQAINYMRTHISENLTVEQIARKCGVCATVLKNIFNEFTGHGVGRHFLNMRIEYAKIKLLQNYSASEISDELKFSSQAYFTQCFKRECGCTPSEFKKCGYTALHGKL